ncbi:MAG: hypothetical protein HQL58_13755 [Magnetococcales bacterium]|nr:hypothetical protein [Magnetococcales bacterium]
MSHTVPSPSVRIRNPILGLLVGAFLLLLTIVVLSTLWMYQGQNTALLHYPIETVSRQWSSQQYQEAMFLKSQIHAIAKIETLKQAFLSGNRSALLQQSLPINRMMLEDNYITHFCFHDLSGVNFLRVHRPDQFGDKIDRHTLKQAQATGETVFGVELGPLGTTTLRVVIPWLSHGEPIGYLELGKEISHIILTMQGQLGFELYTFIDKAFLNQQQWQAGVKTLGLPSAEWNRFQSLVYMGFNPLPIRLMDDYLSGDQWRQDDPYRTVLDHWMSRSI